MIKEWEYYKIDKDKIENIQKKLNINRLLATVIANRNIDDIKVFLNPTRKDFFNPFEMPDMEKAVERIIEAIEGNEKILIYGDYDADGVTSIAVLKSYFKDRGIDVGFYIPNRLYEGYGLNNKAIEKIAKDNYTLIITVDCGITAIKEIEYAKTFGIDVVVTDHHEPGNNLPDAIAVVDCKRKDSKYPFNGLAGVGVAFKLCQALSIKLNLHEKEYLKYLDIVTIGTIADIVPLVSENRVITKLGLKLINVTKNLGLKALLNLSGINKIDSMSIGFGIAPKINACGRMGFAEEALDLLLSNNLGVATVKATKTVKHNNDRQSYEKEIYEDAIFQIESKSWQEENTIVLSGDGWHHGVAGIVSSRITEKYHRPSILVCFENGEEIGRGSGRSIPGFDLHEALMECTDLFETFGGHSMAIGLSIKKENVAELKNRLEKIAERYNIKKLMPSILIDDKVDLDKINIDIVNSLNLLEPLGEANEKAIFAFENLKIVNLKLLTDGKHLKLGLMTDNNTYIDAIGFNMGFVADNLKIGDRVDIAGNLDINSYNGMNSIQINIQDIKLINI